MITFHVEQEHKRNDRGDCVFSVFWKDAYGSQKAQVFRTNLDEWIEVHRKRGHKVIVDRHLEDSPKGVY